MTAEVGVRDEVSTKVEVEEKRGLDLSNGANGTAQEDADGSYVFVGGKDAVEDDPVEADLKANGNGIGELEIGNGDPIDVSGGGDLTAPIQDRNNGEPLDERHPDDNGIVTQNGESSIPEDAARNILVKESHEAEIEVLDVGDRDNQGQVKSDLGLGLEENNESQIGVGEAVEINPDQDNDSVELTADHPVDGHSSATHDNADNLPHQIANVAASQTDVAIGSNGSSPETPETCSFNVPANIVHDSTTAEAASGNPASDLGDNSELAAEIQLGDEIVNSPVPDQSVEGLADGHAQDQDPETIVEVDANQDATEQEISENFPASPVDEVRTEAEVGKSEVNVRESADCDPVDSSELANEVAENCQASAVDEVGTEAEIGKSEVNVRETADSHPVDSSEVAESASVPTVNQVSTVPEVEESVENTTTSPADDVIIEPEVEKSEEKSNGIAGSHCIDNSEIETEVTESFPASAVDEARTAAEVLKSGEDSKGTADSHPSDISEVATEVSENLPSAVDEVRTETEAGKSEWKICADADSHLVDNSEVNSGPVDDDTDAALSCLANGAASESKTSSDSVVSLEVVPSLPSTDEATDSKVDIAVENFCAESSRDMPDNNSVATEPENLNGTANDSEPNCTPDDDKVANIENGGIQLSSIDHDKLCQEPEAVNVVHKDESATSSPEGSAIDTSEGQNPIPEGGKKRFYLVKVPRYDDENLKAQIRQAQLRVEERTESRDAIRAEIQKKRAACKELSDNFEAAVSQERAARDLLRSKRQEIDSLQSVINIEDIDVRIRNMEHMIQHETLPLKEEKHLIREIKQLKQDRENLSSNMGRQDGVQQTSEQKDQIEGRLKSLKKEADILRDNVLKAEAFTKAAKKKCSEENEKLSNLLSEFRSADSIRQEAYAHLQSLKKQSYEKNKYFWQYRDDAKAAYDLTFKGDLVALENLCASQVEKNMDLLNKSNEYRKDYFRCNARSTLRRLKTLDGRSIGPDEEPPVIPHVVTGRVAKDSTLSVSTPEGETRKQVEPAEAERVKDKLVMKTAEEKNPAAKPKKSLTSASPANGLEAAPASDEIQEPTEEEQKKTKEEEELTRKAEELRTKEEEAKLMEQRRLEEKAKAKEALERKKRIAEKAEARAVLRAQKEAEQKEKEREKKARKKERRKAATAGEDTGVTNEVESAPISETPTQTPNESETREKQVATTKKPQKQSQYMKQSKTKSIPPPLRNRGKRRMQPWMWVLLIFLVVFALFLVGNSNFSFKFGLNRFNF